MNTINNANGVMQKNKHSENGYDAHEYMLPFQCYQLFYTTKVAELP